MAEKLTKLTIDALTGEALEEELTSEELAELSHIAEESAQAQASQLAKEEARTSALAKLAALGLTEEEIAAL
jgi:hypothetical protein